MLHASHIPAWSSCSPMPAHPHIESPTSVPYRVTKRRYQSGRYDLLCGIALMSVFCFALEGCAPSDLVHIASTAMSTSTALRASTAISTSTAASHPAPHTIGI